MRRSGFKRKPKAAKAPMIDTSSFALPKPGDVKKPKNGEDSRTHILAVRQAVYERSQHRCEACGKDTGWDWGHAHHRQYRSHSGQWTMENIAWVCPDCHRKIHDGEKPCPVKPQIQQLD